MKRESNESEGDMPPKKMAKGDFSNVSVRFLIPARAAGLIIGKGGENIKRIRSQVTGLFYLLSHGMILCYSAPLLVTNGSNMFLLFSSLLRFHVIHDVTTSHILENTQISGSNSTNNEHIYVYPWFAFCVSLTHH